LGGANKAGHPVAVSYRGDPEERGDAMSYINAARSNEAVPRNRLQQVVQKIRGRAHSAFERRARADGLSLEDWVQVEYELMFRDLR
jgi:hypothetical protein